MGEKTLREILAPDEPGISEGYMTRLSVSIREGPHRKAFDLRYELGAADTTIKKLRVLRGMLKGKYEPTIVDLGTSLRPATPEEEIGYLERLWAYKNPCSIK